MLATPPVIVICMAKPVTKLTPFTVMVEAFRLTLDKVSALVTSSITLGAATNTSRMRFCFEGFTAESGLLPYAPAEAPWSFVARAPYEQSAIDAVKIEDFFCVDIPCKSADLNNDGDVNGGDIARFVTVLVSGGGTPLEVCAGDLENAPDGAIDMDDLDNFLSCLLAAGCP